MDLREQGDRFKFGLDSFNRKAEVEQGHAGSGSGLCRKRMTTTPPVRYHEFPVILLCFQI
jgi:hypothetical protein